MKANMGFARRMACAIVACGIALCATATMAFADEAPSGDDAEKEAIELSVDSAAATTVQDGEETPEAEGQESPEDDDGSEPDSEGETPALEDGVYTITSAVGDGLVLDVYGGSTDNGANVQIYTSNNTLAQYWRLEYASDGDYYTIHNYASGKVLDVAAASNEDGANVQSYAANGTTAQQWKITATGSGFTLSPVCATGKCLDVQSAGAWSGNNVQIYAANGTAAQIFYFTANAQLYKAYVEGAAFDTSDAAQVYSITCEATGTYCVDVSSASLSDGANVQLYESNKTAAQKFYVRSKGNGLYSIVNALSGKLLDVAGGSKDAGANVQQYKYNATLAQLWWFTSSSSSYIIHSANSDLVLCVASASAENGTNVQQGVSDASTTQRFSFTPVQLVEDGYYVIGSALWDAKVLDVASGSSSNGANLQIYGSNGTNAQRFYIEYDATSKTYTITNKGSGKLIDVSNGSTASGANVWQYESNGTNAQKWVITASNGGYSFKNVGSGMFLDACSGSCYSGTNVQQYVGNGTAAQRWVLHDEDWQQVYEVSDRADLNAAITDIILNRTNSTDLYTNYRYVVDNYWYASGSKWPSWDGWWEDLALEMYNNGRGNCYRFACLFCFLAKACGYSDASVVCGYSSGGFPHGWVQIGSLYCDPEGEWEVGGNYFMVTYHC